jgi:hypothetical protein
MAPDNTPRLIDTLRSIMNEVMESSNLPADDPALIHLKHIVLLRIADLEAKQSFALAPDTAPKRKP